MAFQEMLGTEFIEKKHKETIPQLERQVPHLGCAFLQVQFGSLDHLSGHKCSSLQLSIWIPGTTFRTKITNKIGEDFKWRQVGVVGELNSYPTSWSNLPSLLEPE